MMNFHIWPLTVFGDNYCRLLSINLCSKLWDEHWINFRRFDLLPYTKLENSVIKCSAEDILELIDSDKN